MKHVGRIFACLGTFLLLVLIFLTGIVLLLDFGPSKSARNLFVNSAMESSAGKFLATTFLGKKKVKEIMEINSVEEVKEVTNSDLINVATEDLDKIELIDIKGKTYNGFVAIVHDPSRVTIGTSGTYGAAYEGKKVSEMAEKYDAILATNGGGFADIGGTGNGGIPEGIVISDSKLAWGNLGSRYELIGFDKDNKLVVGVMTGQEALDRGVRDALSFGPILLVNGEPTEVYGEGSGLNPRTAIAQRADGAVIIIVIDGRTAKSLGASFKDVQNVMLEYGAVNGANLDGGSSTLLYYEGKYINNCSSLYGPRKMPTAIVVKR